jgi:hypothetical protein
VSREKRAKQDDKHAPAAPTALASVACSAACSAAWFAVGCDGYEPSPEHRMGMILEPAEPHVVETFIMKMLRLTDEYNCHANRFPEAKPTPTEWQDLCLLEQETIEYNYDHYFSGNYLIRLKEFVSNLKFLT